jgi:lysylphosphatidylglycerol synthetase-like protein (DUF2156 family)
MIENKSNFWKNSLIFGCLVGITLITMSVVLVLTGKFSSRLQYAGYLILVAGIAVGTLNFRDKYSGGFLTYGRSLASGVLISATAGFLLGIFSFIYAKYVNPGFIEEIMQQVQIEWERQGMSEDQMRIAEKATRWLMQPGMLIFMTLLGYSFWGTILSLIVSAFVKRDPPPFNTPTDLTPQ